MGLGKGRGWRSTQPSGPLNHLERWLLTTPTTSTTPMIAPWASSSALGLFAPRGSLFSGSRPDPAWTAIVPVACLGHARDTPHRAGAGGTRVCAHGGQGDALARPVVDERRCPPRP